LLVGASVITGLVADLLLWEAEVGSEAVGHPAGTQVLLAAAERRDIPVVAEMAELEGLMVLRAVGEAQAVGLGQLHFLVVVVVVALACLG
jgi:hypothetical protein